MTGEKAERFVVLNLRLMAVGFAITGFFFIAWPDGTLDRITSSVTTSASTPRRPRPRNASGSRSASPTWS